MRGVNDRNFFHFWQILYRATCPSPNRTHWQVGDVDWRKERHSFSATDYAVTLEIHHLRHGGGSAAAWGLMVVIERWWDGDGESLKDNTWARVASGSPRAIIGWLVQQEKVRAALRGQPNAPADLVAQ